jgi:protocatechuate 3,4-dioxygenase beta subunit
MRPTRRQFVQGGLTAAAALATGSVLLPACGDAPPQPAGTGVDAGAAPTPMCTRTAPNALGPYYKPNAPERNVLSESGTTGVPLVIAGRVLDTSCVPQAGAIVDVWQADAAGHRVRTDDQGRYWFRTVVPGHYMVVGGVRAQHLHLQVSGAGFRTLTTQLFFEGDPAIDTDGLFHPALLVRLRDEAGGKAGDFDFVLKRA